MINVVNFIGLRRTKMTKLRNMFKHDCNFYIFTHWTLAVFLFNALWSQCIIPELGIMLILKARKKKDYTKNVFHD